MQIGEARCDALCPGERLLAREGATVEPITEAPALGILQGNEGTLSHLGVAHRGYPVAPDNVGMRPQADPTQALIDEAFTDGETIKQGGTQALERDHALL